MTKTVPSDGQSPAESLQVASPKTPQAKKCKMTANSKRDGEALKDIPVVRPDSPLFVFSFLYCPATAFVSLVDPKGTPGRSQTTASSVEQDPGKGFSANINHFRRPRPISFEAAACGCWS
jgi:hypothetical protein